MPPNLLNPLNPGSLPPGGIQVGRSVGFVGLNGLIYSTQQGALDSNQGVESDFSRSASGACPQDSSNLPPSTNPWSSK